MLEAVLDLLLPPRCGGCDALGSHFCSRCLVSIRRLEEPLCRRCGIELAFARAYCGCRGRLRAIARIRSAGAYEGPLERAVHRFKYDRRRSLAGPLAAVLADLVRPECEKAELVVPVPLHPRRLRQRGFNQAALLANELRRRTGLGRPEGELLRVRDTPPQVGLDQLRRLANVRLAFAWRGKNLSGEPVIVLDDVTTTGATLDACASALRGAGSGAVIGLTLARVAL